MSPQELLQNGQSLELIDQVVFRCLIAVLWVQYVTTEVGSVMENVEERESYINTILIVIALHQDNTNIKIVPRGQLVLGEVVEMM